MRNLNFVDPPRIFTGKVKWYADDNEEKFREHYELYGDDWIWKDRDVSYNLNDSGYRCSNFDKIAWKDSIVLLGCSNVFGVGLDETQTISNCLEKKISIPVINLGVAGSSIATSFYNLLVLIEKYEKPKSVINLWTDFSRFPFWDSQTRHVGPWIKYWKLKSLFLLWNETDKNPQNWAEMFRLSTNVILKSKEIKHWEGSTFMSTADLFDIEYFKNLDLSRDGKHIGPKTADFISSKIAESIFSK